MGFGKRPSSTPQPPAPPPPSDPHGRRKVFPDEVWQGKSGAFLRELGFDPNDEGNLVPNSSSLNARLEQGRAAMEARQAQIQHNAEARLPGAQIRPFFLMPDPCWNGPSGTFMMTNLELFPYDDWNVMFLAGDERTAKALDLAPHPNGNIAAFIGAAARTLDEVQLDLNGAHHEAGRTNNFAAYSEARDDARERVKLQAALFSKKIVELWQEAQAGPAR